MCPTSVVSVRVRAFVSGVVVCGSACVRALLSACVCGLVLDQLCVCILIVRVYVLVFVCVSGFVLRLVVRWLCARLCGCSVVDICARPNARD